ncbi:hypothetical protein NYA9BBAC_01232 [Salinibacterium sp. NYA9b]
MIVVSDLRVFRSSPADVNPGLEAAERVPACDTRERRSRYQKARLSQLA